ARRGGAGCATTAPCRPHRAGTACDALERAGRPSRKMPKGTVAARTPPGAKLSPGVSKHFVKDDFVAPPFLLACPRQHCLRRSDGALLFGADAADVPAAHDARRGHHRVSVAAHRPCARADLLAAALCLLHAIHLPTPNGRGRKPGAATEPRCPSRGAS